MASCPPAVGALPTTSAPPWRRSSPATCRMLPAACSMSMVACTFRGCKTLRNPVSLLVLATVVLSAREPMVLTLEDYVAMPMTGMTSGVGNIGSLARVNVLRDEPGNTGRFFVSDLNGPLYILDKKTKIFTTYLDFNGRQPQTGLFDKPPTAAGF